MSEEKKQYAKKLQWQRQAIESQNVIKNGLFLVLMKTSAGRAFKSGASAVD